MKLRSSITILCGLFLFLILASLAFAETESSRDGDFEAQMVVESSPTIRVQGDILVGLEMALMEADSGKRDAFFSEAGSTKDETLSSLLLDNKYEVRRGGIAGYFEEYDGTIRDGFLEVNEENYENWGVRRTYDYSLFVNLGRKLSKNVDPIYGVWTSLYPLSDGAYYKSGEMPGNPAITTYWYDTELKYEEEAFKDFRRAFYCSLLQNRSQDEISVSYAYTDARFQRYLADYLENPRFFYRLGYFGAPWATVSKGDSGLIDEERYCYDVWKRFPVTKDGSSYIAVFEYDLSEYEVFLDDISGTNISYLFVNGTSFSRISDELIVPKIDTVLSIPEDSELEFVEINRSSPVDIIVEQPIACANSIPQNFSVSRSFSEDEMHLTVSSYPVQLVNCTPSNYTLRLYQDYLVAIDYEPSMNVSLKAFLNKLSYYKDENGTAIATLTSHVSEDKQVRTWLMQNGTVVVDKTVEVRGGNQSQSLLEFSPMKDDALSVFIEVDGKRMNKTLTYSLKTFDANVSAALPTKPGEKLDLNASISNTGPARNASIRLELVGSETDTLAEWAEKIGHTDIHYNGTIDKYAGPYLLQLVVDDEKVYSEKVTLEVDTPTLYAEVRDRDGPLAGVNVTLGTHHAATDDNGVATFEAEEGTYQLSYLLYGQSYPEKDSVTLKENRFGQWFQKEIKRGRLQINMTGEAGTFYLLDRGRTEYALTSHTTHIDEYYNRSAAYSGANLLSWTAPENSWDGNWNSKSHIAGGYTTRSNLTLYQNYSIPDTSPSMNWTAKMSCTHFAGSQWRASAFNFSSGSWHEFITKTNAGGCSDSSIQTVVHKFPQEQMGDFVSGGSAMFRIYLYAYGMKSYSDHYESKVSVPLEAPASEESLTKWVLPGSYVGRVDYSDHSYYFNIIVEENTQSIYTLSHTGWNKLLTFGDFDTAGFKAINGSNFELDALYNFDAILVDTSEEWELDRSTLQEYAKNGGRLVFEGGTYPSYVPNYFEFLYDLEGVPKYDLGKIKVDESGNTITITGGNWSAEFSKTKGTFTSFTYLGKKNGSTVLRVDGNWTDSDGTSSGGTVFGSSGAVTTISEQTAYSLSLTSRSGLNTKTILVYANGAVREELALGTGTYNITPDVTTASSIEAVNGSYVSIPGSQTVLFYWHVSEDQALSESYLNGKTPLAFPIHAFSMGRGAVFAGNFSSRLLEINPANLKDFPASKSIADATLLDSGDPFPAQFTAYSGSHYHSSNPLILSEGENKIRVEYKNLTKVFSFEAEADREYSLNISGLFFEPPEYSPKNIHTDIPVQAHNLDTRPHWIIFKKRNGLEERRVISPEKPETIGIGSFFTSSPADLLELPITSSDQIGGSILLATGIMGAADCTEYSPQGTGICTVNSEQIPASWLWHWNKTDGVAPGEKVQKLKHIFWEPANVSIASWKIGKSESELYDFEHTFSPVALSIGGTASHEETIYEFSNYQKTDLEFSRNTISFHQNYTSVSLGEANITTSKKSVHVSLSGGETAASSSTSVTLPKTVRAAAIFSRPQIGINPMEKSYYSDLFIRRDVSFSDSACYEQKKVPTLTGCPYEQEVYTEPGLETVKHITATQGYSILGAAATGTVGVSRTLGRAFVGSCDGDDQCQDKNEVPAPNIIIGNTSRTLAMQGYYMMIPVRRHGSCSYNQNNHKKLYTYGTLAPPEGGSAISLLIQYGNYKGKNGKTCGSYSGNFHVYEYAFSNAALKTYSTDDLGYGESERIDLNSDDFTLCYPAPLSTDTWGSSSDGKSLVANYSSQSAYEIEKANSGSVMSNRYSDYYDNNNNHYLSTGSSTASLKRNSLLVDPKRVTFVMGTGTGDASAKYQLICIRPLAHSEFAAHLGDEAAYGPTVPNLYLTHPQTGYSISRSGSDKLEFRVDHNSPLYNYSLDADVAVEYPNAELVRNFSVPEAISSQRIVLEFLPKVKLAYLVVMEGDEVVFTKAATDPTDKLFAFSSELKGKLLPGRNYTLYAGGIGTSRISARYEFMKGFEFTVPAYSANWLDFKIEREPLLLRESETSYLFKFNDSSTLRGLNFSAAGSDTSTGITLGNGVVSSASLEYITNDTDTEVSDGNGWKKMMALKVTEVSGYSRGNWTPIVFTFPVGNTQSCSAQVRVKDSLGNEIPSATNPPDSPEENGGNCTVAFFDMWAPRESKTFYIYYDNPDATKPHYSNLPTPNQTVMPNAWDFEDRDLAPKESGLVWKFQRDNKGGCSKRSLGSSGELYGGERGWVDSGGNNGVNCYYNSSAYPIIYSEWMKGFNRACAAINTAGDSKDYGWFLYNLSNQAQADYSSTGLNINWDSEDDGVFCDEGGYKPHLREDRLSVGDPFYVMLGWGETKSGPNKLDWLHFRNSSLQTLDRYYMEAGWEIELQSGSTKVEFDVGDNGKADSHTDFAGAITSYTATCGETCTVPVKVSVEDPVQVNLTGLQVGYTEYLEAVKWRPVANWSSSGGWYTTRQSSTFFIPASEYFGQNHHMYITYNNTDSTERHLKLYNGTAWAAIAPIASDSSRNITTLLVDMPYFNYRSYYKNSLWADGSQAKEFKMFQGNVTGLEIVLPPSADVSTVELKLMSVSDYGSGTWTDWMRCDNPYVTCTLKSCYSQSRDFCPGSGTNCHHAYDNNPSSSVEICGMDGDDGYIEFEINYKEYLKRYEIDLDKSGKPDYSTTTERSQFFHYCDPTNCEKLNNYAMKCSARASGRYGCGFRWKDTKFRIKDIRKPPADDTVIVGVGLRNASLYFPPGTSIQYADLTEQVRWWISENEPSEDGFYHIPINITAKTNSKKYTAWINYDSSGTPFYALSIPEAGLMVKGIEVYPNSTSTITIRDAEHGTVTYQRTGNQYRAHFDDLANAMEDYERKIVETDIDTEGDLQADISYHYTRPQKIQLLDDGSGETQRIAFYVDNTNSTIDIISLFGPEDKEIQWSKEDYATGGGIARTYDEHEFSDFSFDDDGKGNSGSGYHNSDYYESSTKANVGEYLEAALSDRGRYNLYAGYGCGDGFSTFQAVLDHEKLMDINTSTGSPDCPEGAGVNEKFLGTFDLFGSSTYMAYRNRDAGTLRYDYLRLEPVINDESVIIWSAQGMHGLKPGQYTVKYSSVSGPSAYPEGNVSLYHFKPYEIELEGAFQELQATIESEAGLGNFEFSSGGTSIASLPYLSKGAYTFDISEALSEQASTKLSIYSDRITADLSVRLKSLSHTTLSLNDHTVEPTRGGFSFGLSSLHLPEKRLLLVPSAPARVEASINSRQILNETISAPTAYRLNSSSFEISNSLSMLSKEDLSWLVYEMSAPPKSFSATYSNLTTFNDSSTRKDIYFAGNSHDISLGIKLPKNSSLISASLSISGFGSVDIGNDGDFELPESSLLAGNQKIPGLLSELQDYLFYCTPDTSGYCTIPILLESGRAGTATLSGLEVRYVITTIKHSPQKLKVQLNGTNSSGEAFLSIYVRSQGNTEHSSLKVEALGTTYTLPNTTESYSWQRVSLGKGDFNAPFNVTIWCVNCTKEAQYLVGKKGSGISWRLDDGAWVPDDYRPMARLEVLEATSNSIPRLLGGGLILEERDLSEAGSTTLYYPGLEPEAPIHQEGLGVQCGEGECSQITMIWEDEEQAFTNIPITLPLNKTYRKNFLELWNGTDYQDFTPSSHCPDYEEFTIGGDTWKACLGEKKFRVIIPHLSSVYLRVTEKENNPPWLQPLPNVTVNEGDTVQIHPNATDKDGDPINFTYAAPLNSTGGWQTGYDDAGNYTIQVTASDGYANTSQNFTLEVLNKNRPPELALLTPTGGELLRGWVVVNWTSSDPDGESISNALYYASSDSWELLAEGATAPYLWNTSTLPDGRYRLRATASDGGITSTADSTPFTINNSIPTILLFNTSVLTSGGSFTDTGTLATYILPTIFGDTLAIEYQYQYYAHTGGRDAYIKTYLGDEKIDETTFRSPRMEFGETRQILTKATPGTAPTLMFTYKNGDYRIKITNITVTGIGEPVNDTNRPPWLQLISNITINETQATQISPNATDPEGKALGFLFSAPLNSSGGWQTGCRDKGNYTLLVTASDGFTSSQQAFNLEVLETNCLPSLHNLFNITVTEGDLVNLDLSGENHTKGQLPFSFSYKVSEMTDGDSFGGMRGSAEIRLYPITYSGKELGPVRYRLACGEVSTPTRGDRDNWCLSPENTIVAVPDGQDYEDGDELEPPQKWYSMDNSLSSDWQLAWAEVEKVKAIAYVHFGWLVSDTFELHLDDISLQDTHDNMDSDSWSLEYEGFSEVTHREGYEFSGADRHLRLYLSGGESKKDAGTILASRQFNIAPQALDKDMDLLSFTYSSPLDSAGKWQTGYADSGNYTVLINVSDGEQSASKTIRIEVLNSTTTPDPVDVETFEFDFSNSSQFTSSTNILFTQFASLTPIMALNSTALFFDGKTTSFNTTPQNITYFVSTEGQSWDTLNLTAHFETSANATLYLLIANRTYYTNTSSTRGDLSILANFTPSHNITLTADPLSEGHTFNISKIRATLYREEVSYPNCGNFTTIYAGSKSLTSWRSIDWNATLVPGYNITIMLNFTDNTTLSKSTSHAEGSWDISGASPANRLASLWVQLLGNITEAPILKRLAISWIE